MSIVLKAFEELKSAGQTSITQNCTDLPCFLGISDAFRNETSTWCFLVWAQQFLWQSAWPFKCWMNRLKLAHPCISSKSRWTVLLPKLFLIFEELGAWHILSLNVRFEGWGSRSCLRASCLLQEPWEKFHLRSLAAFTDSHKRALSYFSESPYFALVTGIPRSS